jgi:hypothetical protein
MFAPGIVPSQRKAGNYNGGPGAHERNKIKEECTPLSEKMKTGGTTRSFDVGGQEIDSHLLDSWDLSSPFKL